MNRTSTCLTLAFALFSSSLAASPECVSGEVLVKLDQSKPLARYTAAISLGAKVLHEEPEIGWQRLKLPAGMTVAQGMAALSKTSGILKAEPNYVRHIKFTPTDPDWPQQYGPTQIGCTSAWNLTLGSPSIIIAVVDTGIDIAHPEFTGRLDILPNSNIQQGNGTPGDNNGHGTHCSGIAAAGIDNGTGIAGVCPQATIMPIKSLDSGGSGSVSDLASGYMFAADNGANVLSVSVGGYDISSEEQDAVNYVISKGCVFVAAAGNDSISTKLYPAAYDDVIAVGATDINDNETSYTNFGDWVSVAAPGDNILSTWLNNGYQVDSGTSMATPHVAGAVALIDSYAGKALPPAQIRALLFSTCDNVGSWVRYGRINVNSALLALGNTSGGSSVAPSAFSTYEGTFLSGTTASLASLDGSDVVISSILGLGGLQTASSIMEYRVQPQLSSITQALVQVSSSAPVVGQQSVYIYNYLHGRYELLGTSTLTATAGTPVSYDITSHLAWYDRSGSVKVLVRAQETTGFTLYQYRLDQATLQLTTSGSTY